MASKGAKRAGSTSNGPKQAQKGSRRVSAAVGSVVRPHRREIWGLAAIVAGLIVAGSLAVGAATLFLALIVIMPVLGHATWHLYRKAVDHGAD